MQIEELIALLERANKYNRNRELSVVIPIYSPGGIGGTPSVNIQQVHSGFDWDAGKVFLTPENPVTELTPEQVKEIHESVSKGQSWHAYEKWKKNKEEKQALKARLAALEAAVEFKGFDEPMEDDCQIELLDIRGEIETEYNFGGGVWNTHLYVGWRYPVGDLSK